MAPQNSLASLVFIIMRATEWIYRQRKGRRTILTATLWEPLLQAKRAAASATDVQVVVAPGRLWLTLAGLKEFGGGVAVLAHERSS